MNKYLDQLAWLRGIAAFLVICSHTLRAIDPIYSNEISLPQTHLFRLLDLGTFGVLLFFVLSGCTLTVSNGLFFKSKHHIFAFFIKRVFRIWPAFFIAIVIYSIFRIIFQHFYVDIRGFWIEHQFLTPIDPWDYLNYLTLSYNYLGKSGLFNNAFWSLPLEFQYYLIFPLILVSLRFASLFGPITLGLTLYFVPQFIPLNEFGIDKKFYTLAYSFCGGVVLGYLFIKLNGLVIFKSSIALLLISAIFIINGFISNDRINIPDILFVSNKWNFYTLSALAVTGILLFSKIELPKYLNTLLKWMGEVSYSSYLFHNLIIASIMLIIINFHLFDYEIYLLPFFAILITYIISHFSFRHIEKPGIVLGKRLSSAILKTVLH